MVEAVISVVVEKVTGCLLDPVGRQFRYLFNYRRNVSDLNQQIHSLESVRERVQIAVDEANRRGDEIHSDVQDWLSYAQDIVQNRDAFDEAEKIASKSCFYFKSRFRLSKQAKRDAEEVAAKISEASNFMNGPGDVRVSYRPPPPTSVVPFITTSSFKDYEAFESRESTFNQIMGALRNEDIKRVGVWGMGGVGKTTLVKQVAKQAEEEKLFHKVIVVLNVTEKPDIAEIQERIATMVGVTFEKEENKAVRLRQCLKKQGKILVILDDLWEKLEMGEIGIPQGDDDDHKGCKLLLTSRERRVLDTDMRTQMELHLRHLNQEEAWSLFKRTVGNDHYVESPNVQSIALNIVKKCEGLPVAIVTIANALKKEAVPAVWENALEELRRSEPINIRGVSKNVYSCLELSYNHLEGDEVKSLFLLCGLVGVGNISMDLLLQYAMGLNLFKGFHSCDRAANKLIALVEKLKVSSLLLDINEDGDNGKNWRTLFFDEAAVVRMHDVVRDVARSIASRDPHRFVVKEGIELQEWQRTNESRTCSRISLTCRNTIELAQGLVCPQLDFFLLNSSYDDHRGCLKIPDGFFLDTKQLRVLDLVRVSLAPSCSSLGFLSNLQTLCLGNCRIKDIAAIGEMKRLQILSLVRSDIERLPEEMKQLSDLRVLDLWDCHNLKVIPRNVISSLSQLEYLSMTGCRRMQWDPERLVKGINACFSELKHLSKLRALEVEVSNVSWLPKDDDAVVVFNNLYLMTRYSIQIGPITIPVDACKASRKLMLNEVKSPEIVKCFSKLLKRSQFVHLEKLCMNNIYLDDDLDNMNDKNVGFEELKSLSMKECHGIHSIPSNALVKLEVLELYWLDNLEVVFQEPINPKESFANLRKVRLGCCKRLKYVFTLPPATLLNQTAELDFPRLQFLSLRGLNDIINFFCFTGCSHEESLVLFNHKATFPALEYLQLSSLDKVRALWHNQLPAVHSFSKLKTLELDNCKNLLNIFPLSLAKALVQLKHLSIENCEVLEAIVVANEDEDEDLICSNLSLFPKLTSLQLSRLPQLKTFCSGNSKLIVRWPLLKTLRVWYCAEVEILFQGIGQLEEGTRDHEHQHSLSFLDKVAFHSMVNLDLYSLPNVRELWHNQLPENSNSFSKLKTLNLGSCNKMLNIFPLCVAKALVQLEDFCIRKCESVEAIVVANEEDDEEPCCNLFPKLTYLWLDTLPQLKTFCTGRLTLRWPLLKTLEVSNCDKVEILFQGQLEGDELDDDHRIQQPFFLVDKVSFPSLELLNIQRLDSVKALWHNQLVVDSFPNLKELKIGLCNGLLNPFESNIIHKGLPLMVEDCDSVSENIIQFERLHPSAQVQLNVEKLLPKHLDVHFWNLQTLYVTRCGSLMNLLTSSTAKRVASQLKEIVIRECQMMNGVVGNDQKGAPPLTDDDDDEIEFTRLERLTLSGLPNLKSFCSERYMFRFPSLREIIVENCPKVERFCNGVLNASRIYCRGISYELLEMH